MKRFLFISTFVTLALPAIALAQSLPSTGGIFNCNAGTFGGSPGTTAALGGVFVPVNDAAVTLNTGVLVYKECVLKGIVAKQRALMTSAVVQQGTLSFLQGRTSTDANGNTVKAPLYPQNLTQDEVNESDRIVANMIQNGAFNGIDPAYRTQVERAAVRQYYTQTRQPYADLTCPFNMSTLGTLDALNAYQNPACSPYGAQYLTSQHIAQSTSAGVSDMIQKLNWGNGIYDVATPDQYGNMITQTPGYLVGLSENQLIQSGFQQTQQANDINQMVSSLFTGITAQILNTNGGGLAGLIQSNGSQPSYLSQVVSGAQQDAGQSAANAGIAVVQGMRATEQAYHDVMAAILALLTGGTSSFQSTESQCWANIISKTCDGAVGKDGTCTSIAPGCTTDASTGQQSCTSGFTLKIATSTAYSTLATSQLPGGSNIPVVMQNLDTSSSTLAFFDGLIGALVGSDTGAQQQALNQLSSVIASGRTHAQSDVTAAQAAQNDITQQTQTFTKAVTDSWAGTDSNGTAGAIAWDGVYPPAASSDVNGWCNYNNTTTIQRWIAKWKK